MRNIDNQLLAMIFMATDPILSVLISNHVWLLANGSPELLKKGENQLRAAREMIAHELGISPEELKDAFENAANTLRQRES